MRSDDEQSAERAPRRRPAPGFFARPRGAAVRRQRTAGMAGLAVILTALGLAIAAVLSIVGGGPAHGGATPIVSSTSATQSSSSSTARRTKLRLRHGPPASTGPFPVARTSLTLVEPASPGSEPPDGARRLPTVIRYPRVPPFDASARAAQFPLVVFSQGFDVSAESYSALLHAVSAAGYVVADPTYPQTDPAAPGGVDESDIVNHPADLRFVIGAVLRAAGHPHSPLHGLVAPRQVAVVGQSDGGDVSLAVAANSCCQDPVVRAAVILSGAELGSFGGRYFAAGSAPLLVVQGTADTINPPGCSALIYNQAPRPKYYLNMLGAQHLPPYLEPGPVRRGVARVVIAFLDRFLKQQRSHLRRLTATATLGGGLRLSSGPAAPIAETPCPGAP